MTTKTQLMGTMSAIALVLVSSTPAMAEGIQAGSAITNNVDVTFDVGGITQNVVEASDTFAVDRRVNVTVTSANSPEMVNPGQGNAVLTFDVTNLSNDVVDLSLEAALTDGAQANINGNSAAFTVYEDTNGNGSFDNADQVVTYLDEVAADETLRVFVVSDIGLGASNGDEFDITLTADAHASGTAGSLGSELNESSGDSSDASVVDTVLADGAGATDGANDGAFSAEGTYEVEGALVSVTKSSLVISDPVNGTTNPKAIPGAVIRYCIAVSNASGAALATDISVLDDLPADVSFNSGTILRNTDVDLSSGAAVCTNGSAPASAAEGAYDSGDNQVTGTLDNLTGGSSAGLSFEVTIPAVGSGT